MPKASGTVYHYDSDERIKGASVKATWEAETQFQITDDDGDFTFENLDPGEWTLTALHEKSFPRTLGPLDILKDTSGIRIDLFRLQGTEDEALGKKFFIGLLIAFGALVALYFALHLIFPRESPALSETLAGLISLTEEQVAAVDKISESTALQASVADIKADVEAALVGNADLSAADKAVFTDLGAKIAAALKADARDEVLARLVTLRELVKSPTYERVGIWEREPWRFLEILMWGLAGILVNKILITGWYLRSQRFYREGIVMHVAHLVATPLLVLVTVLLLSLVTFQITLANSNELTLDLSDPAILIAFSFLIGTVPWPLWNFIEDTGKRFAGRLS